jgi:hypothetical protein
MPRATPLRGRMAGIGRAFEFDHPKTVGLKWMDCVGSRVATRYCISASQPDAQVGAGHLISGFQIQGDANIYA